MADLVYDTVTVRGQGVRLERMLWKRDRAYTPGLLEAALDANPGLAELGPVLPVGTSVHLPKQSSVDAEPIEIVRLWD